MLYQIVTKVFSKIEIFESNTDSIGKESQVTRCLAGSLTPLLFTYCVPAQNNRPDLSY